MRRSFAISLFLLLALFLVPWLQAPKEGGEEPGEGDTSLLPPAGDDQRQEGEGLDAETTLRIKRGDTVVTMSMDTYLQGVLRAEMPASFQQEALKAQAVAARTYVLYKMRNGPVANHPEADACDDITCCQAFRSEEEAAADWGAMTLQYEAKIRSAVADTDGQAVLYEGEPVLAVFHSSSAGATRNAEEVWSSSVPYLKSVSSPEGEEQVPNYYSQVGFTPEEFQELFLTRYPNASLGGEPSNWFTNIQQQETGTVISLQVGGVSLSGDEMRSLLGLRSAAFTISFGDGEILFSTTGYGHGVGMSQYGANVMAEEGKDYREILTWYYTGTNVEPYQMPNGTEGTA